VNPEVSTAAKPEEPSFLEDLKDAMTIREAAKLLRVGQTTVCNWRREGRLRVVRAGKRVLIPLSSIRSILR
jgi:excisionase family DNA binding protein